MPEKFRYRLKNLRFNRLRNLRSFLRLRSLMTMAPVFIGILAIIMNEWRISRINLSDPLILIGITTMIFSMRYIKVKLYILIIIATFISTINVFVASIIYPRSSLAIMYAYVFKVFLYALFTVMLYSHIKRYRLESRSIELMLNMAVVVSIIGIYISLAISLKLPYEFFWEFTRQDPRSYLFQGGTDIIRTRSIMSEPQYLGLFLNTTILVVLFSNYKINKNVFKISVIVTTAILTFSFATIPTTGLLIIIYALRNKGVIWTYKKQTIVTIAGIGVILFYFWQYISVTIFSRSSQIFAGEDGSASARLGESWSYISISNIFSGKGIGETPSIWNNYAYLISDFGIIGIFIGIYLTYTIFMRNKYFGLFFFIFSFQKGGYLSAFYWISTMFLIAFSEKNNEKITIFSNRYLRSKNHELQ
jgi:hypothetical protein